MLINDLPITQVYVYTGVTDYAVPFAFYGEDSITLVYDGEDGVLQPMVNGVHFSVVGVRPGAYDSENAFISGTLTLTSAGQALLSSGTRMAISRKTSQTQEYEYNEGDSFPAKSHENALGRLTVIAQELQDTASRAVTLPATSESTAQELIDDLFSAAVEAGAAAAAAATSEANSMASALDSANYANNSATQAGNSAQSATAAQVSAQAAQQTLDSAVTAIQAQESLSIGAVQSEGQTQISLATAQADRAKTEADRAAADVDAAVALVAAEGIKQVGLVEAEGTGQVAAVRTEGEIQKEAIERLGGGSIAGTVVAFAGTFNGKNPIPLGETEADLTWQICDGTNGTPNLVDKFIYGGDGTTQGAEGGDVVTEGHTLTVAQLAGHTHKIQTYSGNYNHGGVSSYAANANSPELQPNTFTTGSSEPHSHNQNLPPHIVLAYIMKLPQA